MCLCYCTLYVALSMLFRVWTLIFQSFTFVLHVIILDITKRCVRAREKSEKRYHWHLINTIRKEKKNKTGTAGCGSFVVAYFQPILPSTIYIWCWRAGLEVGKPNNTWPTTDKPLMVTAMKVKGKEHDGNQDLCWHQQDAENTISRSWWRTLMWWMGQESLTRCACWHSDTAEEVYQPSLHLQLHGAWSAITTDYHMVDYFAMLSAPRESSGWTTLSSSKVGRLTADKQEVKLYRGGLVPGLHAAQDKLWQEEHVQWPEAGCASGPTV